MVRARHLCAGNNFSLTVLRRISNFAVGVYHIDLAKMLPGVGIDGKVCIQCPLKLAKVDLRC